MSNTCIYYDKCAYKNDIEQSMKVGKYMIGEPVISCEPCYPENPTLRLQSQGASIYRNTLLVDIDSELMNLNRKLAKDPCNQYKPTCDGYCCEGTGMPCGQGVVGKCSKLKPGQRPGDENLINFPDCRFEVEEYTRLSNPPCTLRSTGWNRWEWLCKDPQQLPLGLLLPFDWHIDSKNLARDNHRPCLPTPIDVSPSLPRGGDINRMPIPSMRHVSANPVDPISVGWQSSKNIRNY